MPPLIRVGDTVRYRHGDEVRTAQVLILTRGSRIDDKFGARVPQASWSDRRYLFLIFTDGNCCYGRELDGDSNQG